MQRTRREHQLVERHRRESDDRRLQHEQHGIEAFSDALAAELSPFGVRVSLIEPGNHGTNIGRNMLARADTSAVQGSRFERQWRSALTTLARFEENPPPDAVADAAF